MSIGKLDTDSGALQSRIDLQSRLGRYDLNEWIFSLLDVEPGMKVLDLGCGTGKQSLQLANIVGSEGKVVSVDISSESLDLLRKKAVEEGVSERIDVVRSELDSLPPEILDSTFDRIVASYSLYYSEAPEVLIENLRRVLASEGVLFFCGPSYSNNFEIRKFISDLKGDAELPQTKPAMFMEKEAKELLQQHFSTIMVEQFENPIVFDDVDSLCNYWQSHNLFEAELDGAFRREAESFFSSNQVFENVKRAIGIKAK